MKWAHAMAMLPVLSGGCGGTSGLDDPPMPCRSDCGEASIGGRAATLPTGGAGVSGSAGVGLAGSGGADAGAGTGGAAARPDSGAGCLDSGQLQVRDPAALDADGDGLFEPGERIEVGAWVENLGGELATDAGLDVTADVPPLPEVSSRFYTLPPHQPEWIGAAFVIDEQTMVGSEITFRLSLPGQPRCALTLAILVSDQPGQINYCELTRQLQLSDPWVADTFADAPVEPGEAIGVGVTLTNPGPLPHEWYPGIRATPDSSRVVPLRDGEWIYALPVGDGVIMSAPFRIGQDVRRGTVVTFTVSAEALNVHCSSKPSIEVPVLVQ